MKSINKEEFYTLTQINKLGITKKYIEKNNLKPQKTYKNLYGVEVKLFLKTEIDILCKSKEVKNILKTRNKKIIASLKATKTKKEKLINEINELKIEVDLLDINLIKKYSIEENKRFAFERGDFGGNYINIPKNVLNRWCVNFIRHNLTSYDAYIDSLYNKVGKIEAYVLLKNKILTEIAKKYPDLKEECNLQFESIEDYQNN